MNQVSLHQQIERIKLLDKLKGELANYEQALNSSPFPEYVNDQITKIKARIEKA